MWLKTAFGKEVAPIQPHFFYNSLPGIKELCGSTPVVESTVDVGITVKIILL